MSITLLLQCQARSNKHSMLYLVVFLLNLISIKHVLQTAFHHPLITISVFTKIFLVVSTKKNIKTNGKQEQHGCIEGEMLSDCPGVLSWLSHSRYFTPAQSECDLNSYHNNMTNYTHYGPFRVMYEELKLEILNAQGHQGSACI